jgi:hypothetical protein
MLKKTITYKDYNGDEQTDVLYFHLNKTDMVELMWLLPKLQAWYDKVRGPERDLTMEETLQFYEIMKTIIEHSYGERSEDGREFAKSAEIFAKFKQRAVYDAFVMSLFENPENGMDFMVKVFPEDLVKKELSIAELPESKPETSPSKTFEDYTEIELLNMSQADFERLLPDSVHDYSRKQLTIAFQRRSKNPL